MTRTARSSASNPLLYSFALFISYALLVSLCAPFVFRRVAAAPRSEKRDSTPASPINGASSPAASPASSQTQGGRREGELIIRFRAGTSEQDKTAQVETRGAHRKEKLRGESGIEKLDVPAGQTPESLAAELLLNPAVEFAEPNFLIHHDETIPNDPRFSEQWALKNSGQGGGRFGADIGATPAWDTTTGSSNTVIAVVDSGIDFSHPDLTNNEWTNPNVGPGSDLHGWDYVTNSDVIKDEQGHGTAVAGLIAAEGNNASGITGVMWKASLMSLRACLKSGSAS